MATLLAIDPGQNTGMAAFFISPMGDWMLMAAAVVSPNDRGFDTFVPDIVVIENPQIYPNSKAKPDSILKLARVVGRYEERYANAKIRLVTPHEWKGSVDGDIMTRRIEAAMTADELDKTKAIAKSVRHNAIDAIGLGKWSFRQPWMRAR